MAKKNELPKWLIPPLQGLAFWIGHRHSLFKGYHLLEAALVAESCNLIQANLPKNELILIPECLYKNLLPFNTTNAEGDTRADLVLCSRSVLEVVKPSSLRKANVAGHVKYVIEFKRGGAPQKEIHEDLSRLSNFLHKTGNEGARCFLIVVYESSIPKHYTEDIERSRPSNLSEKCRYIDRRARRGKMTIETPKNSDDKSFFKVRRVVKAATSFDLRNEGTAHYVCVLEVFKGK